jgi:DNA-binding response OmpR family regulator
MLRRNEKHMRILVVEGGRKVDEMIARGLHTEGCAIDIVDAGSAMDAGYKISDCPSL